MRVDNELRALGKETGALSPEDLYPFDNMHYDGVNAVAEAIEKCNIQKGKGIRVLDLGSGLGGPSRYLAKNAECNVTALELQEDCSKKAKEYTKRCNMESKITHITGDILESSVFDTITTDGLYHTVVSWLVFLHISDKKKLFEQCKKCISNDESGGYLYFEDFYNRGGTNGDISFTSTDITSLAKDVYCCDLPTQQEYIDILDVAGFDVISFDDLTETWSKFVVTRLESWISNKDSLQKIHGGSEIEIESDGDGDNESVYATQLHFFQAIVQLFRRGNGTDILEGALGGCRVVAKKRRDGCM